MAERYEKVFLEIVPCFIDVLGTLCGVTFTKVTFETDDHLHVFQLEDKEVVCCEKKKEIIIKG